MTAPALPTPAPGAPPVPLADGEVVLLVLRPSLWFIVLKRLGSLVAVACIAVGVLALDALGVHVLDARAVVAGAVAASALVMLWFAIDRATRLYVLTDRRVVRISGVFRQVSIELPLRDIVSLTLYRSLRERLSGPGTVVFSTPAAGAASGSGECSWFMIPRPAEHVVTIRRALSRYGSSGPGAGGAGGA
jgi:hypothetical protein